MGLPSRVQVYADAAHADRAETLTYYDGTDFVGEDLTVATHGFVSRVTQKIDHNGTHVNTTRAKRDEHGNSIETIDPNGAVDNTASHRRSYVYDDTGFFLSVTDLHVSDGYRLRRESRYQRAFQKVSESTKWMGVRDGSVETNRDSDHFLYDDFARLIAMIKPGDDLGKPTKAFTYELGSPFSTITIAARSTSNGAIDEESIRCLDGKGRVYQDRNRVAPGQYQVTGFKAYNARGNVVEVWQPFTSPTAACDFTSPTDVLSTTTTYDALARVIENSAPGETIYGERTVDRTVYLPLGSETWDSEDTAVGGAHVDTPTLRTMDGT